MTTNNAKLELNWIGKHDKVRLEPRILIQDADKSFGEPLSKNMLIKGDNLLALKALEQDFAGRIKCIYIDPPYNTGAAFEFYDDGREHSIWLSMMQQRLTMLHKILHEEGTIFVSIDNNEMSYLQVLMDEIFGRKNRKNIIILKRGSVTGAKVINPGLVNISEFILVYAKNTEKWKPNRLLRKKERDSRYGTYIENFEKPPAEWQYTPLLEAFAKSLGINKKTDLKKYLGDKLPQQIDEFVIKHANRVMQLASLDDKSISRGALNLKYLSKQNPTVTYFMEREGKNPYYIYNGKLLLFVKDRLAQIDGGVSFSEPLTDIWDDVLPNDLHNEGGVEFRKGKKPEKLISRILELATKAGDFVLDSFLGSGTTAAVAHKMGRNWIGIEMGNHADTHCLPRLQAVVRGEQGGISKAVNWKGGGGFKYFDLAAAFLIPDVWNEKIINPAYNYEMTVRAVAKHQNCTVVEETARKEWWQQATNGGQGYLCVITAHVTAHLLKSIAETLREGESVQVCCLSHDPQAAKGMKHISLLKLPESISERCEYKPEGYTMNIIESPFDPPTVEDVPTDEADSNTPSVKKGKIVENQGLLF